MSAIQPFDSGRLGRRLSLCVAVVLLATTAFAQSGLAAAPADASAGPSAQATSADYAGNSLCDSVDMDVTIDENSKVARVSFPSWYTALPTSVVVGMSSKCADEIHNDVSDDFAVRSRALIAAELAVHIKGEGIETIAEILGIDQALVDDAHHANPADLELEPL